MPIGFLSYPRMDHFISRETDRYILITCDPKMRLLIIYRKIYKYKYIIDIPARWTCHTK